MALLLIGAVAADVGGFDGKAMGYRLPLFLAPGLAVTGWWWRRRGPYPTALDAALTLPFLIDTAANAIGVYDHFDQTDDVLHFVNWFILIAGITRTMATSRPARLDDPALIWLTGVGIGAVLAVLWEAAEYLAMRSGVGGLQLTYADTITDLLLSTAGGAAGAATGLRTSQRRHADNPNAT